MGQALTKNGEIKAPADLLYETQIFASWTIADVRELWRRFQNQVFGFSIVEIQFESIMSFKESVAKYIDLDVLFNVLDNDNDGRIDGLELLAGIALCSMGTFEEKTRFCFEMFDFNLNASLSKLEMVMLMVSCICGMILITGGVEENEPDIKLIEAMVEDAFLRCDLNQDGLINYDEFVVWARTNRDLMSALEIFGKSSHNAKLDIDTDDSAEVVDEGDVSDCSDYRFNEDRREIFNLNTLSNSDSDDDELKATMVPWRTELLEPTNFRSSKELSDCPDANLTLNWVFGYKSRNIRSNLKYVGPINNANPQYIVYNTAALIVVYDKINNTQSFYQGHDSEITCIAVHPSGTIIATGDSSSHIHIWDVSSKVCSLLIRGLAHEGVQHLAFSPSGDRIVTIGLDPDHSVAIYDASSGNIISSARGIAQPNQVMDVAYSCSGSELAIVGRAELKFFTGVHTSKRAIDSKFGRIGHEGKKQTFFSAVYMQDDCVVGCASGEIYRFRNAECLQIIQAHGIREPILTMYFNPSDVTLVTGGADCLVKTWDFTLNEVGNSLDLSEDLDGDGNADSGSLNSQVISVESRSNRILIGTKGGDIFEATTSASMESNKLKRLGWSHPYGELWGLGVHPVRSEFVTCGDDKTIRMWNILTREQTNLRVMPCAARAVSYNNTGDIICIGMEDGTVCLMDANSKSLKVYSTWRHSTMAITVIKFSADGQYIAIGSKDANIYIYHSGDKRNYRRQALCKGHSGHILYLDFSLNSKYIISNAADMHSVTWDMNGNIVKNDALIRNLPFATYTCPFTWGVSGAWRKAPHVQDITTCHALPEIDDLVTGDVNGCINLFRYPCIPGSLFQTYVGHSQAITSVRFTANRRYLISIGGLDRTILVWKHDLELCESSDDDEAEGISFGSSSSLLKRFPHKSAGTSGLNDINDDGSALRFVIPEASASSVIKQMVNNLASSEELAEVVKAEKIPGYDLVMPWKSTVIEPSDTGAPLSGSTDIDATLQWVHGHRSFDCRNNVMYSASGAIVYNAACLAIVYNKASGKQKFLQDAHCDEVISIAVHPTGQIFATGETGISPSVFVWNAASTKILQKLQGHVNGVPLLAFNKNGNLLATVGQDSSNTLILYDWSKNVEIFRAPTSKHKVFATTFMSFEEKSFVESQKKRKHSYNPARLTPFPEDIVITAGVHQINFWWYQGKNVVSQSGLWGKEPAGAILSIISGFPNVCVTGLANGKVLVWKDFRVTCSVSQHQGKVESIWCVPGQIFNRDDLCNDKITPPKERSKACSKLLRYITGDDNGGICIWALMSVYHTPNAAAPDVVEERLELVCLKTINSFEELRPQSLRRGVRSICERDGVLLIGTRGGEIYELPIDWELTIINGLMNESSVGIDSTLNIAAASASSGEVSNQVVSSAGQPLSSSRQLFGHFEGEVWGLAVHPTKNLFFTTGDDRTLRCWTLEDNKVKFYCVLPESSKAIDITTDGSELIIGLDNGDVYSAYIAEHLDSVQKRGAVPTYGLEVLWKSEERKEAVVNGPKTFLYFSKLPKGPTQWVQALKVSPSYILGDKSINILAVGSHDKTICVYLFDKFSDYYYSASGKTYQPTNENFRLVNILSDHTSFITHIDFGSQRMDRPKSSESSAGNNLDEFVITDCSNICMQSSSGTFELFYWTPVTPEMVSGTAAAPVASQAAISKVTNPCRVTTSTRLKDATWATWTCPFGWPVQGVWPPMHDGINVTSVCRSNFYKQVPVLAAVTDYGHLKLFNYPCVTPGSPDKCYRGHSTRITNVQFSHDDRYCITVGGTDRCIFVWATDINEELLERQSLLMGSNRDFSYSNKNYDAFISGSSGIADQKPESLGMLPYKFKSSRHKHHYRRGNKDSVVRPWRHSIKEPTTYRHAPHMGRLPDASVELSFVYGYRGWDCRNNIGFADSRFEVVYHSGAVGVVYNTQSNQQVHNCEHDDDVISLAIHPEGHTVATGEIGPRPKIVLWDANTGVSILIIKFHKKGVSHLGFSGSGMMLVSCGMDDDRYVAVHNVSTGTLIGTGKAGRGVDIFCLAVCGDSSFCTAGRNHVKFWAFSSPTSPGGEMSSKGGIFNNKGSKSRIVTTATYLGVDAVTGMYDGSLLLWKDRTCARSREGVHNGPVSAMCQMPISGGGISDKSDSGPQIISGGKDGMIYVWTGQLEAIWKLDMNSVEPRSILPDVQALAFRENRILVGTKASEIYEFNRLNLPECRRIVVGHHIDKAEVWGLATHPEQLKFVTCGDDSTVRLWSSKTNAQLQIVHLGVKARACAFSRDGSQVAIGTYDGRVKILSEDLLTEYADVAVAKAWIQVLQFSPNNNFLAVGGHDNIVYIMDTTTFSIRGKCKGHKSFIQAIDFSVDSTKIQSCSGANELLFWDTSGNEIVDPSETRDLQWSTWTCAIGWPVQGVWASCDDYGGEVNSVDRSPDGQLVVAGGDNKYINLFTYPCLNSDAKYIKSKGHADHITRVRYTYDGKSVISLGGLDKTILKYDIKS